MTGSLTVGIAGAGLGGLTLASVLHNEYNIKCTIFELENSPSMRSQGGSLDLHVESGQHALKKAGLFEEFKKHARYQGQELRITGKTVELLFVHDAEQEVNAKADTGAPEDRPEIDRKVLRQILIDSVPEDIIQWGKKVANVEPSDGGKYTIAFTDGTSQSFDLVVGADGAWSKVRSLVSSAVPEYTGVKLVEATIANADQDYPETSKLVGPGTLWAMADNRALMAQRNGDGTIRTYVTLRLPSDALSNIDFSDLEAAKSYFLEKFSDYDEPHKNLIRNSHILIPRDIFILPTDHKWKTRVGITLVGDAAHLMTPFAGEGANMAMWDGANLADAIAKVVQQGQDLKTCLEEYEQFMFETCGKYAAESLTNMDKLIADGGAQAALDFFLSMGPPPS
jgi:2-polyprenyl-6-methoxyphenol hydroxylase-like FAD-dependent oxidoreductase